MKTTSNHQFYVSHFLRTMVFVDNIVCFALDHHRCKVRFSLIFLKHINLYLKGSTFAKTGSIDKRRIFFFGNHRIRQSACKANIFNTPKSICANWFFTTHCYFSQVNNYPIAYCHFCTKRLLEACWSTCKQT